MSVFLFTQRYFEKKFPQATRDNQTLPPFYEEKYRFIMIREELVTLTGDSSIAALLGQLMYWSQEVPDFAFYMEEEKESSSKDQLLHYGWFHKPIYELIDEAFLNVSVMTLHRYLRFLIDREWIRTRVNCDGKTQYRVNIRKLCREFHDHGYSIPRFAKAHFLGEDDSSKGRYA